jgi:hypothetical protein
MSQLLYGGKQAVSPRGSGAVARLSRRAHIQSLTTTTMTLLDSRATAPLPRGGEQKHLYSKLSTHVPSL